MPSNEVLVESLKEAISDEELANCLMHLPQRRYGALLRQVELLRRQEADREEARHPLHAGMTRDEFAFWMARRNYEFDPGVTRILYFPTGAPPDEVRLLECTERIPMPDREPIRASRYELDFDEVDFKVYVADAGPVQLQNILDGRLEPPPGWILDGYQEFRLDES